MTTALEPQIRELSQAFDATIDPVSVDEVLEGIKTTAPERRRSPRSAWVATAALAAIMLLPLMLLANRWFNDEPFDDPPPTSTTIENSPTTTVPPEPPLVVGSEDPAVPQTAADAGWTWTKIAPDRGPGYRVKSGAIVRFAPGWECRDGENVYASRTQPGGLPCLDLVENPTPVVEISDDGVAWRPGTVPPAPESWVMHHYQNGAGGYLYILFSDLKTNDMQWYGTSDGVDWFEAFNEGVGFFWTVASFPTDSGAVAVLPVTQDHNGGVRPAANWARESRYLVSTDGGRTYFEGIVPASISDHVTIMGAVDGGLEVLVWSGVEPDGIAHSDPVVWRSTDGIDWTQVGVATGLPTLDTPRPVVSYPDGSIKEEDPRPGTIDTFQYAMWQLGTGDRIMHVDTYDGPDGFYISEDGLTWSEAANSPNAAPRDGSNSMNVADGWLVVTVGDGRSGASTAMATRDGTTWVRFRGPDGTWLPWAYVDNVGVIASLMTSDGDGTHTTDPNQRYRALPPE